jgi:hypothetical protein
MQGFDQSNVRHRLAAERSSIDRTSMVAAQVNGGVRHLATSELFTY